jgi:hypothetical protein
MKDSDNAKQSAIVCGEDGKGSYSGEYMSIVCGKKKG